VINKNFLQEANILDMSREIFNSVVGEDLKVETRFQLLSNKIQDAENINFILADGLGFLNLQSTDSFLNEYVKNSINTTFPSSTNVALATIAMLKSPIDHGIFGYYMYDKIKFGLINALNWNAENKNLLVSKYFNSQSSIWSIFKENNIHTSNFQPKNLINTPLSKFLYEEKSTVPYIDQDDLLITLSDALFLENKFNFIYYPNIDVSAHVFGVNSDEWNKELKKFEDLIKKITELSNKKSYTVISADHGLSNIPKKNRFHLSHKETIDIFGDQRSVYINGTKNNIAEAFANIPGQLIDRSELNHLLPEPKNDFIESLYPDYCFLVNDKNIIYPHHLKTELAGYHGGLSEEEIKIPIIEISNF
tara:strand:- start:1766 stop:2854 length:1089 start_codon:yes stop_codon:yes gene_type:complete